MSKLNHERWILRLIDDASREKSRNSDHAANEGLASHARDPDTPPVFSGSETLDPDELSLAARQFSKSRSAIRRKRELVEKGEYIPKRVAKQCDRFEHYEGRLQELCEDIFIRFLKEAYAEAEGKRRSGEGMSEWLHWWSERERRLNSNSECQVEVVNEILRNAAERLTEQLELKSRQRKT